MRPRFGYWSRCENKRGLPTVLRNRMRKSTRFNISSLDPQQRAKTWHTIKANNPALAELLTEASSLVKAFDAQVIIDIKDLDK